MGSSGVCRLLTMLRLPLLLTLALSTSAALASPVASASGPLTCNVRNHGAVGDNATLDTSAFTACLALIRAAGGGTLLVPSPGAYLIAPINLTSHMVLHVAGGATVVGVMDLTAWPVIAPAAGYGQGRNFPGGRYTSLIHGEHLVNVTIQGDGIGSDGHGPASTIDGQGAYVSL